MKDSFKKAGNKNYTLSDWNFRCFRCYWPKKSFRRSARRRLKQADKNER